MNKNIKRKLEELENKYGNLEEPEEIKLIAVREVEPIEEYGEVVGTEIHKLEFDELLNIISSKKYTYYNLYHREPQYIKMPTWIYHVLREKARKLIGYSIKDNVEKFMEMQIIYTPTINDIHEIELL